MEDKKENQGINFKNISQHLTTDFKKDVVSGKKKLSDVFKLSSAGEHHFKRLIATEFENKQVSTLLDKIKFWK